MPGRPRAQVKGPRQSVLRDLPALGQLRTVGGTVQVEADHRTVDQVEDRVRLDQQSRPRVEGVRAAGPPNAYDRWFCGIRRRGAGAGRGHHCQKSKRGDHSSTAVHHFLLRGVRRLRGDSTAGGRGAFRRGAGDRRLNSGIARKAARGIRLSPAGGRPPRSLHYRSAARQVKGPREASPPARDGARDGAAAQAPR
jgi:hypothetical protein